MSENFYQNLTAFTEFDQLTEDSHFYDLPRDWHIIISDVQGSTQAIETGRYQEVNTVGAATIACAQNALQTNEFPFVFGGDGATLLVHSSDKDAVIDQLLSLKDLSQSQFDLSLRVGSVPVDEIYKENGEVKIAKYEITKGQSVAIFKGGGVTLAEEKIKNSPNKYQHDSKLNPTADLSGLSCRWNPIPSKNGSILSILIAARNESKDETYKEIIEKVSHTLNGSIENANPVQESELSYHSFSTCVKKEYKYHSTPFSLKFLFRMIEILYCVLVFKHGWPAIFFDSKNYFSSMQTHSDHKKFDDMLRMVIDCNHAQVDSIKELLKTMYEQELVYYGIHSSSEALMTCLVQSPTDGKHIHFIDGSNGGYAMAAKELKLQMSTTANDKRKVS